jgi:hypothetical protein
LFLLYYCSLPKCQLLSSSSDCSSFQHCFWIADGNKGKCSASSHVLCSDLPTENFCVTGTLNIKNNDCVWLKNNNIESCFENDNSYECSSYISDTCNSVTFQEKACLYTTTSQCINENSVSSCDLLNSSKCDGFTLAGGDICMFDENTHTCIIKRYFIYIYIRFLYFFPS